MSNVVRASSIKIIACECGTPVCPNVNVYLLDENDEPFAVAQFSPDQVARIAASLIENAVVVEHRVEFAGMPVAGTA